MSAPRPPAPPPSQQPYRRQHTDRPSRERAKAGTGCLGVVAAVWRGFDLAARLVFNAIVLGLVFLLLIAVSAEAPPLVPSSAVLVIAPQGQIVEQLSGDPVSRALAQLSGEEQPETLLRDLVDAIRAGRDDKRVKGLLIDVDQMTDAALTQLQELRREIDAFKTSGKPVLARGDYYGRSQYYLASTADEIYLNELGLVVLEGYGVFPLYFKEGIDRFGIDWNVFKVGEYKSAVEPFELPEMAEDTRRMHLDWLTDLWDAYLADVAAARDLTPEAVADSVERFNELLAAADGQAAEMARLAGLVDHVGSRELVRDRLIELAGENDEHDFNGVRFDDYLAAGAGSRVELPGKGDKVAVIVASGMIVGGTQPPGTIGADSTAALIRRARHDDQVKAVVLRVDSGGGSAFASEVIRRELELTREAGKKVVVSMASVAASGGYWIAMASDEIWASPTTITGSIGIYGMFPTFQRPLAEYLGTQVSGVGTTWMAGAFRLDRELDERAATALRQMIERGYRDFLDRVAAGRNMTVEEVDDVARGRVWSGVDAEAKGLVDRLGGLDDAVASAAALAGLGEDPRIEYLEEELSLTDQLLLDMLGGAAVWFGPEGRLGTWPGRAETSLRPSSVLARLLDPLERHAELLAHLDDPRGLYALCLCEVE